MTEKLQKLIYDREEYFFVESFQALHIRHTANTVKNVRIYLEHFHSTFKSRSNVIGLFFKL